MFGKRKKCSSAQRLEIENNTSAIMSVMIEVNPDQYMLNPGDRMVIEADLGGAPYSIIQGEGGMTIYPGNAYEPPVTINGKLVEPH